MYALILTLSTPFTLLATVMALSWWEDRILPTPLSEPTEAAPALAAFAPSASPGAGAAGPLLAGNDRLAVEVAAALGGDMVLHQLDEQPEDGAGEVGGLETGVLDEAGLRETALRGAARPTYVCAVPGGDQYASTAPGGATP